MGPERRSGYAPSRLLLDLGILPAPPRLNPRFWPRDFRAGVDPVKLTICPDAQGVALACADAVSVVVGRRAEAVLILPAGNTPRPLLAELVRRHRKGTLDLSQTHIVQLDELVGVPGQDPRSFQAFLKEHLLDPLGRDGSRDHLLDGAAPDPRSEIERHAAELERLGPVDLAVLGLGLNGHVAFNEPGTPESEGARLLSLAAMTQAGLKPVFAPEERPTEGITLGLAQLRAARSIRLLVTGASKASILAQLLGEERSRTLPASLLAPHPDFEVYADRAALPNAD